MANKVLIIAPHPDDEVLGCGGIMKKYTHNGDDVYVIIMTKGTPSLYSDEKIIKVRREALQAHKILGVKETKFMDFFEPELDLCSLAVISEAISSVIKQYNINILYIPHRGDIHHDHRAVFNASIVAARPVGNYSVKQIYAYETLSETEWAPPFSDDAFIPTYFVNIQDEINDKVNALMCYTGQIKEFPSSRSVIALRALAQYRGATVGFSSAEAFMLIRSIQS